MKSLIIVLILTFLAISCDEDKKQTIPKLNMIDSDDVDKAEIGEETFEYNEKTGRDEAQKDIKNGKLVFLVHDSGINRRIGSGSELYKEKYGIEINLYGSPWFSDKGFPSYLKAYHEIMDKQIQDKLGRSIYEIHDEIEEIKNISNRKINKQKEIGETEAKEDIKKGIYKLKYFKDISEKEECILYSEFYNIVGIVFEIRYDDEYNKPFFEKCEILESQKRFYSYTRISKRAISEHFGWDIYSKARKYVENLIE